MMSMDIAATGMQAQQTNVEVISNNIANMNTTAYSRRRPQFSDLLYENLKRVGTNSSDNNTIVPTGIQIGLGVQTNGVYRLTTEGSLVSTDNTLDTAIQGRGYFQIQLPTGEIAYTRDGSFQLSSTGQIVTQDGYTVLPGIIVPTNATGVTINTSGQVSITLDGQVTPAIAGQFQTAIFPNEAGLEAEGDNIYLQTAASGTASTGAPGSPGFGTILQGYLESSNVNVVTEITDLISAQRAYEMNSKVIQSSDEMMQTVTQLKS